VFSSQLLERNGPGRRHTQGCSKTGPKFKHRIEAIVEKFADMQADLDRERKAMRRLWAKREAQIYGVIESTAGMYGDLQGIAGRALQEIEELQIPLLEGSLQDETLGGHKSCSDRDSNVADESS
jgi:uncharacterized protein DUF2130